MWTHEESIETTATVAKVWELFSDVNSWNKWNPGNADIKIYGPFAAGTTFTMQLPGEEETLIIRSALVTVEENKGFTDETVFEDTCILVHHQITLLASGNVRVTYSTEVTGTNEAEVGAMVTSDFPDVLKALKTFAENSG